MARWILSRYARAALICLAIALATISGTRASDRQRSGFVMGVGFGLSPVSTLSSSYVGHDFRGSGIGMGINLLLGYGITKHDVLAAEINVTSYRTDYSGTSLDVTQGIGALTWYRYFGEVGRSYIVMGGLGAYCARERMRFLISICFDCPDAPEAEIPEDWGVGFIGGVGRELSDRFQLVIYGAIGFPSGYVYVPTYGFATKTVTAAHLNILVTWMYF